VVMAGSIHACMPDIAVMILLPIRKRLNSIFTEIPISSAYSSFGRI